MSTTTYTCDHCGKPCTAKTVIYNRYKTHFCGKGCKAAHQRGAKDRAKDERIRELEANGIEADGLIMKLRGEREMLRSFAEGLREKADTMRSANKALEQRNRKLRALAWVGWTSCLLCLLWALWGQRKVDRLATITTELYDTNECAVATAEEAVQFATLLAARIDGYGPDTIPATDSLVVAWQGESRTPHIAYVDSLGEWRDADNGERLEVTKWSRP